MSGRSTERISKCTHLDGVCRLLNLSRRDTVPVGYLVVCPSRSGGRFFAFGQRGRPRFREVSKCMELCGIKVGLPLVGWARDRGMGLDRT